VGAVGGNIGAYCCPDIKAINSIWVVFDEETNTGGFFQVLYGEPSELIIGRIIYTLAFMTV